MKSKKILSLSPSNGFGEATLFVIEELDVYKEVDSKLSLDNNELQLLFQYFGDNDINELTLEIINNENTFTKFYKDLTMNDDGFYVINFHLPEEYSDSPGVPVDAEVVSIPFTESFNANTREASKATD